MTRLAGSLAIVIGVIFSSLPAQAQGEAAPVSFLKEMLGIRSRAPEPQAAPLSITAPAPAGAKAASAASTHKAKTASGDKPRPARTALTRKAKSDTDKPAAGKASAPLDNAGSSGDAAAPVQQASTSPGDPPVQATPLPEKKSPVRLPPFRGGGSQAVCVRTCDGYFFPVNYEGAHSNDRYAEACQLACPAAATEVYFMPRGGELHQAATQTGHRYTALPAAFRYRKERDASCSCKAQEQMWGEVLAHAEPLVKRGATDILVTPRRSNELARPGDAIATEATPPAEPPRKAAEKKARTRIAGGKPKPAQAETWKTTNRFVKIDPEPTASISVR